MFETNSLKKLEKKKFGNGNIDTHTKLPKFPGQNTY